jgi:ABC-type oligopeptide transport system substrate-binding subunit
LYTFSTGFGPGVAQVVQFNAKQIGLDVEIRTFDRATQVAKLHTPGEPFDIGVEGWGADYPDPANFINQLLSAKAIPPNGVNHSYYDDAAFTRRMEAAAMLTGDAREKAYALLDRDLMAGPVPMIPFVNTNARVFVSPRVRNFRYHSVAGTLLNVVSVIGD